MYIDARVLTATLLLVLPSAATAQQACPTGWFPSPANAAWGPRCYLVPPERSTSLFRCVELCAKEHEGTLACIGSLEENDFVTGEAKLVAADGLWLGLYQNETGLGPAKGWDRCVAGDAPNFTNWDLRWGEPDDLIYQEDCTGLDVNGAFGKKGAWRSVACDIRGVYSPVYSIEFNCLCTRGNASAAFRDGDREALEATVADNKRLIRLRTAMAIAPRIVIAVLPSLLLLAEESSAGRAGAGRAVVRTQSLALGTTAAQPRPHCQRRRRLSARPRALLAPQRSRDCCARRERRPLDGGCASAALSWCRRCGRLFGGRLWPLRCRLLSLRPWPRRTSRSTPLLPLPYGGSCQSRCSSAPSSSPSSPPMHAQSASCLPLSSSCTLEQGHGPSA
jgi:hypothetical protein